MSRNGEDIYPFSAIVGQEKMTRALLLNAVSPSPGGLLIRGEKGTAKSTAVRALASLLPEIDTVPGCPFNCDPRDHDQLCPECLAVVNKGITLPVEKRRMAVIDLPLGATEDRVIGSLDLEYALKEGKRRFFPGLLAAAHRGILYVDEVNLLNDAIVDVILDAAGMGMNVVEREGVSCVHRSQFILIGTMNPEEGELRPHLLDRFGMCVEVRGTRDPDERVRLVKRIERFDRDPSGFVRECGSSQRALSLKITDARKRLGKVRISEEMLRRCSQLAMSACAAGHRADILMGKTALSIAAFEGRETVTPEDVEAAADLVLFHRKRMTRPTTPPEPEEKEKTRERPPEKTKEKKERSEKREGKAGETRDAPASGKTENAQASEGSQPRTTEKETVLPVGETFTVKRIRMDRDRKMRKGSGRRSRTRTCSKSGRYIGSTVDRKNNDLALDATLRAAAPHQKQRSHKHVAIAVRKEDIREKIREKRIGNFIVFVVDASGSMGAGRRMTAVKGAILSLLLDAYQKRDKIALVAFKGDRAETLLPPTNSVELAHKLLEVLPTGGKTPLCHGISMGHGIIKAHLRKDPNIFPLLILISDGKANVSRYGGKPLSEAMAAAEELGADPRIRSLVVDVERPGLISFGLARQLSLPMGAKYFKIEDLKAELLVDTLRERHMIP